MFRSACSIDIVHFPFDEQTCSLKLASWTYDLSTMDLKNKSDSAQMDSYVANGEWALESNYYPPYFNNFHMISYNIKRLSCS